MTTAPPKTRLLILDEDRIILQSLGQFLRREGYEVLTSDEPDQALADLQSGHADVLIADINMPGLKPQEFLRDVRRRAPHVVVVVLTGYGSIEGAVEATRIGVIDYLTKPVIDDEIRIVVEKAARQQALLFENQQLRKQLDSRFGLDNIVGHDARMRKLCDLAAALSDGRTTALITGENGTGKLLLARAIHLRSPRRDKPFVEVNCGALPEPLLEAELFGVAGVIATGTPEKPGRLHAAEGGTILINEIECASPAMQIKLLRALQEHLVEPVGSNEAKAVDVRMIFATTTNLEDRIATGQFRQDLFYRINVVTLAMPSLRDRIGDIPLLADHFLRQFCGDETNGGPGGQATSASSTRRQIVGFTDEAINALQRYDWPGNVRELENAIERAVVVCPRPQIDISDLPDSVRHSAVARSASAPAMDLILDTPMPLTLALEAPERRIIEAALKRNHFCRQTTAAELDINRTTLYKKMRKYGLGMDVSPE